MAGKAWFSITVEEQGLKNLQKLFDQLPGKANLALENGANKIAENMKARLMAPDPPIFYQGGLYNSIEAVPFGDMGWGVKCLDYGQKLNRPGPTVKVNLKDNTKLAKWAADHNIRGAGSMTPSRKTHVEEDATITLFSPQARKRYEGWIDVTLEAAPKYMEAAIQEQLDLLK